MKCKFKINDDLLEMTITIPKKKLARDERVRVSRAMALELAKEFKCPKNTRLGKCLTLGISLDNFTNERLEDTWLFELEKLQEKTVKAVPKKKKSVLVRSTKKKKEDK